MTPAAIGPLGGKLGRLTADEYDDGEEDDADELEQRRRVRRGRVRPHRHLASSPPRGRRR